MIDNATGFSIGSSDPIDSRLVLSKEQMKEANDNVYPQVYFTACSDDGYIYLYNKDNEPSEETGKFVKVGSLNDFVAAETVEQINEMLIRQDGVWKTTTIEDAVKSATQNSLDGNTGLPVSDTTIKNAMGAENGFATLDTNGRIPSEQLPTSAIEIVGEINATLTHSLPDAAEYTPGSQLVITTKGYIDLTTDFTLVAGKKLTELEVAKANTLLQAGYVFTVSGDGVSGTVKSFGTELVVLNDDTEIELPYASDLTATSVPGTVKVDVVEGDYFMAIDGHWIHMSNTGAVTSVNGKTGAVTIPFELTEAITANVTVGGIDSGVTIPAKTSFEELFNNILVKYIKPSVTLKLSVSSLRAKWDPISSVTLTTSTTKGTSDIKEIELKAGSEVIQTQTSAGAFDYVADISTNTTFTATVKDIKDKTGSASASVGFVVPYYYGVSTATSIVDPTTLTQDISNKGNKTYKFTANEQYMYIAYDYSYDALTSIQDSTGFENKDNFTDLGKVTVTKNGTDYDFRVYRTSSVQTQSNFSLTFKH